MEQRDLEAVKAAVETGVKDAIANPDTWRLGIAAMQSAFTSAAQKESGRWLIGWFGWIIKKAALSVAILGVLYYTGGLAAVTAYLKVK